MVHGATAGLEPQSEKPGKKVAGAFLQMLKKKFARVMRCIRRWNVSAMSSIST